MIASPSWPVTIHHTSWAAGPDRVVRDQAVDEPLPSMRRRNTSRSPATVTPIAHARTAGLRSCASQIARAKISATSGTSTSGDRVEQDLRLAVCADFELVRSAGSRSGRRSAAASQRDPRRRTDPRSGTRAGADRARPRRSSSSGRRSRRRGGGSAGGGRAVRSAPDALHLWRCERTLGALLEHVAQAGGRRRGERLRARRQRALELARDVHVRVQLVDEVGGQGLPARPGPAGPSSSCSSRWVCRRRRAGSRPRPFRG